MCGRWNPGWIACAPWNAGRSREGASRNARAGRALYVWGLLVALVLALSAFTAMAQGAVAPKQAAGAQGDDTSKAKESDPSPYFMTTPQLDSALTPLKHLPADAVVSLHAIVVTLPDPLETTMGRSFDLDVAALIRAYQARDYELDGFAFSWTPREDADEADAPQATASYDKTHRAVPSLMLFRRDDWRGSEASSGGDSNDGLTSAQSSAVTYDLVYLVGESPSYGVQLREFEAAARCALLLDGVTAKVADLSAKIPCDRVSNRKVLRLIAPTYSGSMQSLAVAIKRLDCGTECATGATPGPVDVQMLSPTASVRTNEDIAQHGFGINVQYASLSWTLEEQMATLVTYLCSHRLLPDQRIVFLVEESTFGRGAGELAKNLSKTMDEAENESDIREGCPLKEFSVSVRQFSPNISSIRAEHSRLRKAEEQARQRVPIASGRLLELDMASAERGSSRPPIYQPGLTSRSDELLLHRIFDSLRMRAPPDAVVIVATDVRDRLFLLSEVRKALPSSLPVVLEMDYLAVHPDYRAASRGAIVVPAREPTVCVKESDQTLAACSQRRSQEDCPPRTVPEESEDRAESLPENLVKLCQVVGNFLQVCNSSPATGLGRYSFSTDFSANVFRAAFLYAGPHAAEALDPVQYVEAANEGERVCRPTLHVATLAGFQGLPSGSSTMVAADYRLSMQKFWYLGIALLAMFFFLVAVWLKRGAKGGSAMSNFTEVVLMDSRWLIVRLQRWYGWLRPASSGRRSGKPRSDSTPPSPSRCATASLKPPRGLLGPMVVVAGIVAAVALVRLWQVVQRQGGMFDPTWGVQSWRFSLAHGRDIVAVYCLWALYGCVALVGVIRLSIAGRRYAVYGKKLGWPGAGENGRPWLIPVVVMIAIVLAFYLADGAPVSVDLRTPWLVALLVQVCAVAFLFVMWRQTVQLGRLTLWLSSATEAVRTRKGKKDWPTPNLLQVKTQTPFNVSLDARNVSHLKVHTTAAWINWTRKMIAGGVLTDAAFSTWEARLVAELKLLVVAIRAASWCAMAAPVVVLLAMSAYTPVYEPWFKAASVSLLLVGFVATVIVVLHLEKDPMFGPMFTRHGDDLSFGGGLRALWPKFAAMGAVLIPLVLPEVMDALHAVIRSINSLG